MEAILPNLRRDYERWADKLGPGFPQGVSGTVSIEDVLRAHYLLCDFFLREGEDIAVAGPRDGHLLPSAVGRQFVEFGGTQKYSAPLDVCATLFYGLIKDHPFHDGNKRTAFLVAVYHLYNNKRILTSKHRLWEELAVRTAGGALSEYVQYRGFAGDHDSDVAFISDFFRRHTRREDKRHYTVTFNQLRTILHGFGFDLDEPSNNYINVVQEVDVRRGPVYRRRIEKETRRLVKIGFPGWTRQVGRPDIKKVRQATGLTPDRGVDSQVFFKGADPMESLIPKYQGILVRLRDR